MPEMSETGMELEVQGMELPDVFMPECDKPEQAVAETELEDRFMSGWDMAGNDIAGSISQPDSMGLFSEDTAPTKIYEPKHRKKETGLVFQQPEQTKKMDNDWMIYG